MLCRSSLRFESPDLLLLTNFLTFNRSGCAGLRASLASFHAPSYSSVLLIGLVSLSASSIRSATAPSGDCKTNNNTVGLHKNPHDAELFASIFPSFKAGIANAISSFKWRKIYIFLKISLQYWVIRLTKHLNRIYTVIYSQLITELPAKSTLSNLVIFPLIQNLFETV